MGTPHKNACGYVYVPKRSTEKKPFVQIVEETSSEEDIEDYGVNAIVNLVVKKIEETKGETAKISKITVMKF